MIEDEVTPQRCPQCGAHPLFYEKREGRFVLVQEDGKAHAPHCPGEPFPNKGYN